MICIFLIYFFCGCTKKIIEDTGKIQYNDFEGGFYGIISNDGEKYDPINLPEDFKIDGLLVRYKIRILDDQVSVHMWGMVVEIINIEKL